MRPSIIIALLPALLCAGALLSFGALDGAGADDPLKQARRLVARHDWDGAEAELDRRIAAGLPAEVEAEAWVLVARAQLHDERPQEAALTAEAALASISIDSRWRMPMRFLLADAAMAAGRLEAGAERWSDLAGEALSDARRGSLARAFESLADEAMATLAAAEKTAVAGPDPARAAILYEDALRLARDAADRERMTRKLAHALRIAGDEHGALAALRRLEKPWSAALELLEIELAIETGAYGEARAAIERSLAADPSAAVRGELLWLLGRAFRLPFVGEAAIAEEGAAAWRRLVEEQPAHTRAPAALHGLIDVERALAREAAAAALAETFLSRHRDDERAPEVAALLVDLRQMIGDFDGATAAARRFLELFPDHQLAPRMRGRPADLLLQKADLAWKRGDREAALGAWTAFLQRHPGDSRAAEVSVSAARVEAQLGRVEDAMKHLESAQERYRTVAREEAARADLELAMLIEEHRGAAAARARYRHVIDAFSGSNAAAAAARKLSAMEREEIGLSGPGLAPAGEPTSVALRLRNVATVTLRLYRVDYETWFVDKRRLGGLEEIDVGLVKPARTWTVAPEAYAPHVEHRLEVPIADLEPGLWILTAEDGKRRARLAFLVSNLRTIVKASASQVFVWVFDAASGSPVADARVLLSARGALHEKRSDADGVCVFDREGGDAVFVAASGHVASGFIGDLEEATAPSYRDEIWIDTDRPLLRPGDEAAVYGFARKGGGEGYSLPAANDVVRLRLESPSGRTVAERTATLDESGAFAARFGIAAHAEEGDHVVKAEWQRATATCPLRVEASRAAELDVRVALTEPRDEAFASGAAVEIEVTVRDFFGRPASGATVDWRVGREPLKFDPASLEACGWLIATKPEAAEKARLFASGRGVTSAEGTLRFLVHTDLEGGMKRWLVSAAVSGDERALQPGYGQFFAGPEPYFAVIRGAREAVRAGEEVGFELLTVSPDLRPIARSGVVEVLARQQGGAAFALVDTRAVTTGIDGRAQLSLRAPAGAEMMLRYRGGRDARVVVVEKMIAVADARPEDEHVILRSERRVWRVGDEARLHLETPAPGRPVLLTFETDRVLAWRVVRPDASSTTQRIFVAAAHAPGVTATASLLHDGRLLTDEDEIAVTAWLDLEVTSDAPRHAPGGEVVLDVRTRDQLGNPVPAMVAVFVVDQAVLALVPDDEDDPRRTFRQPMREHVVGTSSSIAFDREGSTEEIDPDLLRELERAAKSQDVAADRLRREVRGGNLFLGDEKAESDGAIGFGGGSGGAHGFAPSQRRRSPAEAFLSAGETLRLRDAVDVLGEIRQPRADTDAVLGLVAEDAMELLGVEVPAVPAPRRRLLDVALVKLFVRTDAAGAAELRFTLPDNLTRWQVRAVGASGADLFGTTTSAFEATRPLAVSHLGPRNLLAGDVVALGGTVRNLDDAAGDVRATLREEGGRELATWQGSIPASGAASFAEAVGFETAGERDLVVEASSGRWADAVAETLHVKPFGRPRSFLARGSLETDAAFTSEVTGAIVPGTGRAVLVLSGSALDDVSDGLAHLFALGDGWGDGPASRLLAAASLLELHATGGAPAGIAPEVLRRAIEAELSALDGIRAADGGLCWRPGGPTDADLTAHALDAMAAAQRAGVPPSRTSLDALRRDASRLLGARTEPADTEAALIAALAASGGVGAGEIERVLRRPSGPSAAGLARLLFAARLMDDDDRGRRALQRLRTGFVERGSATVVVAEGAAPWYAGEVDATAWALRALAGSAEETALAARLAEGLRAARGSAGFGGTKATATALAGLGAWLGHAARHPREGIVEVEIDGEIVGRCELGRRALGADILELPFETLAREGASVVVRSPGIQGLRYVLRAFWLEPAETIAAEDLGLKLSRELMPWRDDGLAAGDVEPGHEVIEPELRPRVPDVHGLREVLAGERYLIRLAIDGTSEHRRLELDVPLPAGFVLPFAELVEEGRTIRRLATGGLVLLDRIERGRTIVEIPVLALHPGSYRALPATVALRHREEVRGSSASMSVVVHERTAALALLPPRAPTPDEIHADAARLFAAERWIEAIDRLEALETLALRFDVALETQRLLVLAHLRAGDGAGALEAWRGFADHGRSAPVFVGEDGLLLGRALLGATDAAAARSAFAAVLDAEHAHHELLVRRLHEGQRPRDALEARMAAAALFPPTPDVLEAWFEASEAWFSIPRLGADGPIEDDPTASEWERGVLEMRRLLAHAPESPLAAEIGSVLVHRLFELGRAEDLARDAEVFMAVHARTIFAAAVQYRRLQAAFARQDWAEVDVLAKSLLEPLWLDGSGVTGPSDYREEALWYLARLAHVRGDLEQAVELYGIAGAAVGEARVARDLLVRPHLSAPQRVTAAPGAVALDVRSRNVDRIDAAIYALDLPLVFAEHKGLAGVADVDLTGLAPDSRHAFELEKRPYRVVASRLELDGLGEGGWLVVLRGGGAVHATVLVVTSLVVDARRFDGDLVVELRERDGERALPDAAVRVSDGRTVTAGRTDERGLYVLERLDPDRTYTVLVAQEGRYAMAVLPPDSR